MPAVVGEPLTWCTGTDVVVWSGFQAGLPFVWVGAESVAIIILRHREEIRDQNRQPDIHFHCRTNAYSNFDMDNHL